MVISILTLIAVMALSVYLFVLLVEVPTVKKEKAQTILLTRRLTIANRKYKPGNVVRLNPHPYPRAERLPKRLYWPIAHRDMRYVWVVLKRNHSMASKMLSIEGIDKMIVKAFPNK